MVIDSKDAERDAALLVAKLMLTAARTAPKAGGRDSIVTAIVSSEEKKRLADKMVEMGKIRGKDFVGYMSRDAGNVESADLVILIGVTGIPDYTREYNCGACGFKTCDELRRQKREAVDYVGPNCVLKLMDLGIALGSAAKIASQLNVDSRIMHSVGAAARRLRLIDADVILGIPISIKGKSIFFDRRKRR